MNDLSKIKTYNEWSAIIHDWAVEKGWWEEGEKRDHGEMIFLVVTELVEAYEDWRVRGNACLNQVAFTPVEGGEKPDGFPIEIADVFIRLLDLCAFWKIDVEEWVEYCLLHNSHPKSFGNLGSDLLDIANTLVGFQEMRRKGWSPNETKYINKTTGWVTTKTSPGDIQAVGYGPLMGRVFCDLEDFVQNWMAYDADIFELIKIKHEYNMTRAYRHGGKHS